MLISLSTFSLELDFLLKISVQITLRIKVECNCLQNIILFFDVCIQPPEQLAQVLKTFDLGDIAAGVTNIRREGGF